MRGAVRATGLTLGIVLAVLLAFPRVTGLTGMLGLAQLIAFRAVVALGLAALAALLLALPGRRRRRGLVAVVTLAALLQVVVLADRGLVNGDERPVARAGGDLVVLAANTQDGTTAADLARLVRETNADVVMLAETSGATAHDVAARLASAGVRVQMLARPAVSSGSAGTALLVRSELGEYRIDAVDDGPIASFTAVSVDGSGPTLAAVHPSAPSLPAAMPAWRRGTAWATATCRDVPGAIVAGDFNSTLDHPAFAHLAPCLDAAAAAGAAGLGSWPSDAPRLLATPIDHVLVDGRRWRVRSFAVLDAVRGSDHRPVVAHLSPR